MLLLLVKLSVGVTVWIRKIHDNYEYVDTNMKSNLCKMWTALLWWRDLHRDIFFAWLGVACSYGKWVVMDVMELVIVSFISGWQRRWGEPLVLRHTHDWVYTNKAGFFSLKQLEKMETYMRGEKKERKENLGYFLWLFV